MRLQPDTCNPVLVRPEAVCGMRFAVSARYGRMDIKGRKPEALIYKEANPEAHYRKRLTCYGSEALIKIGSTKNFYVTRKHYRKSEALPDYIRKHGRHARKHAREIMSLELTGSPEGRDFSITRAFPANITGHFRRFALPDQRYKRLWVR